jgi:hypothetical protein
MEAVVLYTYLNFLLRYDNFIAGNIAAIMAKVEWHHINENTPKNFKAKHLKPVFHEILAHRSRKFTLVRFVLET